jgi:hypothetical protein
MVDHVHCVGLTGADLNPGVVDATFTGATRRHQLTLPNGKLTLPNGS